MPDERRDHLVVVDPDDSAAALARIGALGRVEQVLPPRLAIVRAEREVVPLLMRTDGVLEVVSDTTTPDSGAWTDGERLFIDAWVARRADKQRPGEGLHWDAPGFLPPDRPDGSHGPG